MSFRDLLGQVAGKLGSLFKRSTRKSTTGLMLAKMLAEGKNLVMARDPDLMRQAAEMAKEQSYVESELPEIPELTGDSTVDARLQFALSPDGFERLGRVYGLGTEEMSTVLLGLADNLGTGLSPEGKRQWFSSMMQDSYSLEEMITESERYKESIAT